MNGRFFEDGYRGVFASLTASLPPVLEIKTINRFAIYFCLWLALRWCLPRMLGVGDSLDSVLQIENNQSLRDKFLFFIQFSLEQTPFEPYEKQKTSWRRLIVFCLILDPAEVEIRGVEPLTS